MCLALSGRRRKSFGGCSLCRCDASCTGRQRTVDNDMSRAMPRRAASRASSRHDEHQSGTSLSAGRQQPAGRRLGLGGPQRCERDGTAAALAVLEPGQARLVQPATPAAHGVPMQPRLPGDACVGASTRDVQHHPSTHPQPMLGLVAVGHVPQPHAFGDARGCRTGGADGRGGRTGRRKWITGTPHPAPPVTAPAPAMTGARGHLDRENATSTWSAEAATFTWSSAIAHGRTGVPPG